MSPSTISSKPQQGNQTGPDRKARLRLWWLTLAGLGLGLIAALLFSACWGAVTITPTRVFKLLVFPETSGVSTWEAMLTHVLWEIRFPRIVCAALIGAGLGLTGAAIQGLFRNPLAEPGLIGVSAGAALGAVGVIMLSQVLAIMAPEWILPVGAFAGGFLFTWLVRRLASKSGRTPVSTLLLAGIALNAFGGAVIGLAISFAGDRSLREITFWLLGSLNGLSWTAALFLAITLAAGGFYLLRQARPLNALLLGEAEALHLGYRLSRLQLGVTLATAIIVGTGVALGGMIGFVGLVVPHLLRLTVGSDHRLLLPGSMLLGAILLVLADTACRSVGAHELPIGVLTALIGAPFFLWLIRQHNLN